MVNGELPLLQAQGIPTSNSDLVIQVRCPAGLSVLTAEDALTLMQNIQNELRKHDYVSKSLREWKRKFDEMLASMTEEELDASLSYTYDDDGVHVCIDNEDVCIGWPDGEDDSSLKFFQN
jgi:hypothetical protein